MLDDKLKQQLSSYLQLLQQPVVFTLDTGDSANGTKVRDFLNEVVGPILAKEKDLLGVDVEINV